MNNESAKHAKSEFGTQDGVDFDAHYRIKKPWARGVAWFLLGWEARYVPELAFMWDEFGNEWEEEVEGKWVPDVGGRVVAVMVGDDRRFVFDLEDLEVIKEDSFCSGCGQIGCGWC